MIVRKVKVLITVDSLNSGGTERQVIELIKGFYQNNEFEISVLTLTRNGYYDNIARSYTTLYQIANKPGDWKRISTFKRLYKLINSNQFDIVHTMSLEDSCMVYILSKLLNFKWVNGSIRDADARINRRQLHKRLLLKQTRYVVANSFAGLQTYNINCNSSARVIYNGVDLNRFLSRSLNKNQESSNELRLCSVANLTGYKDYYTIIEAINLLKDMPISLHILGEGPLRAKLESIVREKWLQDKVTFYGKVNNVESVMSTMDCGVLMSYKSSGEGLPNAILEFLSSGVPVIASNVGGVSEVVNDGFNGILVEPENPLSLSEAIKKVAQDKSYLSFLSGNTISVIERKFTLDRMIEDYRGYYNHVVHE